MKKFEVTQFHSLAIGESYFVKLNSGRFSSSELKHIRMLRRALNRKYPNRKNRKATPASWRLVVETFNDVMTGRLDILLPGGRNIEWQYQGTTEEVCAELGHSLEANP